MISRSYNLRRLSFVLLAAERNHHLNSLPSIQEKLVEILRTTVVSPRVHSEVYVCLRVLMCRISPQHLANFWPVILAELLRVFEATMDNPPADDSEDLLLVLAACKFLDLLLVIQTEDFQMWVEPSDASADPPATSGSLSPTRQTRRTRQKRTAPRRSWIAWPRFFWSTLDPK